jgi:hypothetical protein
VSTIEELLEKKSSGSSRENRDYGCRDPLRHVAPSIPTNSVDKWRSIGRYSSLSDSGHWVCFLLNAFACISFHDRLAQTWCPIALQLGSLLPLGGGGGVQGIDLLKSRQFIFLLSHRTAACHFQSGRQSHVFCFRLQFRPHALLPPSLIFFAWRRGFEETKFTL